MVSFLDILRNDYIGAILTLLDKILILTLLRMTLLKMTLLKVYEEMPMAII